MKKLFFLLVFVAAACSKPQEKEKEATVKTEAPAAPTLGEAPKAMLDKAKAAAAAGSGNAAEKDAELSTDQ